MDTHPDSLQENSVVANGQEQRAADVSHPATEDGRDQSSEDAQHAYNSAGNAKQNDGSHFEDLSSETHDAPDMHRRNSQVRVNDEAPSEDTTQQVRENSPPFDKKKPCFW